MPWELRSVPFIRAVFAEFVGTMVFVIFGVGSASLKWCTPPLNILEVSLANGLGIGIMVQGVGHISGAHLNPAVTLAFLFGSRISLLRALFYVAAQVLGGIAGSAILYGVTPPSAREDLAITQVQPGMAPGHALVVEMILTFQLILCVLATTDDRRTGCHGSPSLAIAVSVTLGHLVGIPFTGASMNPARSFGPAVVIRKFPYHWIYWVGPIVGAIVTTLLYNFVFRPRMRNLSERLAILKGTLPPEDEDGQQGRRKQSVNLTSVSSSKFCEN
ncbi:lens fiber major intrinsic protein-like [Latimeria chalumnae]|uniref:lens fiber major intrinsic protein-like n=1 Tax=Latimeria chalumnae TaxID=7897 RepID=UPI0003C16D5B|nr:PREDICTED: lens fiber major intrinsic protein-like [Latimeria chalumnae]|eukprot:XP_005986375.1 PREDICTED: lens fiber major intrinsic protein-like [Latimeria chalumnae]